METTIADRALLLINHAGLKALEKDGTLGYNRWQNVRHGKAKIRAEELDVLQRVFPQYRLWLISGEIAPEIGQTSPAYDDANAALKQRGGV